MKLQERSGAIARLQFLRGGALGALLCAGILCARAESAWAQADSAAARALFAEARKLMESERYDQACPKLEESLRLDHGMGTQFNLAHCWEKVGRTASAWALFLDVAAEARAGNQPDRESAARDRANVLEARLTRLRIDISDVAPDLHVERDGQDVGKAAWGTGMPIDPGKHVVRVSAPGKRTWSTEVEVPATARTFTVAVPALLEAPLPEPAVDRTSAAPPAVEPDAREPRAHSSNSHLVAALVVGGVGLAAAATGTIFALQSRSDNTAALGLCRTRSEPDAAEGCSTPDEQQRHADLVDDAERGRLLGFIGLGVGGAALVTAVVLYATGSDGSGERESAFEFAPVWAPGVRGAALTAHF